MASIIINEIDKTIYNVYENTSDNIVYVVGSATKGSTIPTLCTTYDAFIKEFGSTSPIAEDDSFCTSWSYAVNLLLAGFPVLFRRCVSDEQTKASITYDYESTESSTDNGTYLVVTSNKYGSYYNRYATQLIKDDNKISVDLYDGQIKIASKVISVVDSDDTTTVSNFVTAIGEGFVIDDVIITKGDKISSLTSDILGSLCADENHHTLVGGTDLADGSALAEYINDHSEIWDEVSDNILYDLKFVTCGGNTYSGNNANTIYNGMVALAQKRRDCVAILDVPFTVSEDDVGNYFNEVTKINSSYASAFAPYCYFALNIGGDKIVAPSFVFLYTLANSLASGNSIFNPPAGVRRGAVSNINKAQFEVGSSMLDQWQNTNPQSINPIMLLRNYGYVIFGQRTLLVDGEGSTKRSALKELSVRLVANEIKRMIRTIAISLTFEANTLRTWNEFKGQLDPYLAQILAVGGIEDYQIIMDASTTTVDDINNNTIRGIVKIVVSRSAENFVIDFEMSSNGTVFSGDVE